MYCIFGYLRGRKPLLNVHFILVLLLLIEFSIAQNPDSVPIRLCGLRLLEKISKVCNNSIIGPSQGKFFIFKKLIAFF